MGGMMAWIRANAGLLVPLVCGGAALWLLMPRVPERPSFRRGGAVAGLAALICGAVWLMPPSGELVRDVLFYLFSGVAIVSGALMVTNHKPVYSALWFALATLSVCGLFLLLSAPFLAAATVIVYAGAIVVTFLFVIMLAQQEGLATYDRSASQPLPAILATFLLLGGMIYSVREWREEGRSPSPSASASQTADDSATEANLLSRPADGRLGTMRGLGRSLFGDYLFAVELAGTLLLVAAVGAIAIAPRRSRGTL